jgi:hypothetical protein
MTLIQKALLAATIAVLAGVGIYEARQAARLSNQIQAFQQQQPPFASQVQEVTQARDEAVRQLAALREENERLKREAAEILRLRNEVGLLRGRVTELSHPKPEAAAQSVSASQATNAIGRGVWSSHSTVATGPEISIEGLGSSVTVEEVIARLGQPSRTNAAGLEFANLGIFINPQKRSLTVFPPFAGRTRRGIGMGSHIADVVQAYGEPTAVNPTTDPGAVILKYDNAGIRVQLRNGQVDWMMVTSQSEN